MEYVLAIDIGASSGRHMLAYVDGNQVRIEEVYRFQNQMERVQGHDVWNVDALFEEIIKGMRQCAKIDKIPKSVAIDTWACDFVLCDALGKRMGECVSYRDERVEGIMEEAHQKMSRDQLYRYTGIQFQKFNTLYQLLALRKEHPKQLQEAKHFLMVPDYFNFLLSGIYANEYSNASTTQMMDAHSKTWCEKILDGFDLPKDIFHEIQKPGTSLGNLTETMKEQIGYDCEVVLCASHDTGSAFGAVSKKNSILVSSGTWSLLGVLLDEPRCDTISENLNFTNEGGCFDTIRYLKNIMGLWMIQEVYRQYDGVYRYADFVNMARLETEKNFCIDVNDQRFLHPINMIEEIQNACVEQGFKKPVTPGEIAWCIYDSLAYAYHQAIIELEGVLNQSFGSIHIFGGGCQNMLLNETIQERTKKKVELGPVEATALGNIVIQMLHHKWIKEDQIQSLIVNEQKNKEVM